MTSAPPTIRWFEGLLLVAISANQIRNLPFTGNVAEGPIIAPLVGGLLASAIGIVLTLLVSRRRKNWARWTILGYWILAVTFVVWQRGALALFPSRLTVLFRLMHVAALVLVFTPQAGRWLRTDQSENLQHIFE